MNSQNNVAIVGLGRISEVHVKSIISLGFNIRYMCDIDSSKFNKYKFLQNVRFINDYQEIEEVDCVHVCTDHSMHFVIAKYFIEKGIDVFCEKVFSNDFKDWLVMQQVIKENNARLGICYQNRYNPGINRLKTAIANKDNGDLVGVQCEVLWCREEQYYKNNWQASKYFAGGGVLTTQASHTLELLVYLLGACRVEDVKLLYREGYEVETTAIVNMNFNNIMCNFIATVDNGFDSDVRIVLKFETKQIILDGDNLYKKENGKIIEIEKLSLLDVSNADNISWGSYHEKAIKQFYLGDDLLELENVCHVDELLNNIYKISNA